MQYLKVCEEREGREGEEEGKREGKGGRGWEEGKGTYLSILISKYSIYQCPQSLYRLV